MPSRKVKYGPFQIQDGRATHDFYTTVLQTISTNRPYFYRFPNGDEYQLSKAKNGLSRLTLSTEEKTWTLQLNHLTGQCRLLDHITILAKPEPFPVLSLVATIVFLLSLFLAVYFHENVISFLKYALMAGNALCLYVSKKSILEQMVSSIVVYLRNAP